MPDEIIPPSLIKQDVEGDRNLGIGSMSGNAKAIGSVQGDVTFNETHLHQSLPRQLSLHQLPNDIADFTGREAELEQLTQLLQPSGDRPGIKLLQPTNILFKEYKFRNRQFELVSIKHRIKE